MDGTLPQEVIESPAMREEQQWQDLLDRSLKTRVPSHDLNSFIDAKNWNYE